MHSFQFVHNGKRNQLDFFFLFPTGPDSFVPVRALLPSLCSAVVQREVSQRKEEETALQMMNPPLDCILSIWVHPVGQSQVLESS